MRHPTTQTRRLVSCGLLLSALALPTLVQADVIYRVGGGKIEGVIDLAASSNQVVIIETTAGRLAVPRSDIKRVERTANPGPKPKPEPAENFEQARARFGPTAEEQYQLALWCKENRLSREYRETLQRVIELDPNHVQARKRLGFAKVRGEWLDEEARHRAMGLVEYRGRWVLPQEKADLEAAAVDEAAVKEFYKAVRTWQNALRDDDRRAAAAREELRALEDPRAVPALLKVLGEDGNDAERGLLVEVLQDIRSTGSTEALLRVALEDPQRRNRLAAADALLPRKTPAMLRYVASRLGDEENDFVRTAGELLEVIGDGTIVPALIEGLETDHVEVVDYIAGVPVGGTGERDGYKPVQTTFENGFMVRRRNRQPFRSGALPSSRLPRREYIPKTYENPQVLQALKTITGSDHGFDEDAWREWLRNEYHRSAAQRRVTLRFDD